MIGKCGFSVMFNEGYGLYEIHGYKLNCQIKVSLTVELDIAN